MRRIRGCFDEGRGEVLLRWCACKSHRERDRARARGMRTRPGPHHNQSRRAAGPTQNVRRVPQLRTETGARGTNALQPRTPVATLQWCGSASRRTRLPSQCTWGHPHIPRRTACTHAAAGGGMPVGGVRIFARVARHPLRRTCDGLPQHRAACARAGPNAQTSGEGHASRRGMGARVCVAGRGGGGGMGRHKGVWGGGRVVLRLGAAEGRSRGRGVAMRPGGTTALGRLRWHWR